MADWLDFELDCTNYLNRKFADHAHFQHLGGEDSTVADIRVVTRTGREFFMDAKLTPAQCGQFVLLPDVAKGCFAFSNRNKTALTDQVRIIMDHMNANFEAYKEAGTAGKDIVLNDGGKVFAQWIISAYRQKGVEFFITNHYTILPIGDFEKHFDAAATYRVKRSGSASVGTSRLPAVLRYLKGSPFPIDSCRSQGSKLLVYSSAQLHNRRFILGDFEYMFSARTGCYEIRKLSNTFNANVIFTISRKNSTGLTDAEFEEALN